MNISQCRKPLAAIVLVIIGTAGLQSTAHAANIVINNVDEADVGFNDQTSVTPLADNMAGTLGAQRLAVFEEAAEKWGELLSSEQTIIVQGSFGPLECNETSAVLGAAGAIQIFADTSDEAVSGLLYPNTWYHVALANKLHDVADLAPNTDDDGLDNGLLVEPFGDDIVAFFNGDINGDQSCLGGANWYYGFDHNEMPGDIDLLAVLMHELAHGLGFANFIDDATGEAILNMADIYTVFSRDNTSGKNWNQMTNGERSDSAVNTGNLVWTGPAVEVATPFELAGLELIRADGIVPDGIAFAGASYGPAPKTDDYRGIVVLVEDTTRNRRGRTDGCETIVNASAVLNNIALIDRGNCNFTVKTMNAEAAGANAVLIANNVGDAIGLGGDDPDMLIKIPSLGIGLDDENALKDAMPGAMLQDIFTSTTLLAGADGDGFVRLYAPNPVEPGSSVSHFDTTATPNLLMEPFINDDLTPGTTNPDLTTSQFTDIGWNGGLSCPDQSNTSDMFTIIGCATLLTNKEGPFQINTAPGRRARSSDFMNGGCYLADLYDACGADADCLEKTTELLLAADDLTASEAAVITACFPGDPGGGFCPIGEQPGDSCSANSDCCSNKCKGRPDSMTCK